ncbi:hypothetical protein Syun_026835 [Stephania yunnanensis]|uniref:Uncharacterized protein n=1 Tax=Stephania yunnanensis TaxID=152371 RepID=A0AAP0EET0_9MAGN
MASLLDLFSRPAKDERERERERVFLQNRGFASSRAGKRSAEEESGFRPSALWGGDGKYYAHGGRATKGSFSQRDWRGGHGSEQGRQHDVTVRRRFTRWELVGDLSWPRSRDEGARDTVAGRILEDDQEGVRTMDDDNFIDDTLEWIRRLLQSAGLRFFGEVEGCQREVARSEVDTARAILGQAYATITSSEEILLAAIQTESRHGNKKESDILMARQKTLFVGCKRFTNLSKLTCRRLLTSTRIQSGVKINVKHLVPYYGDTSDDDNSRANSVHPWENDEVQELARKFLIG